MANDETLLPEFMEPRTIWAPDGTKFNVQVVMNHDIRSPEEMNDIARFLQYEVRGPEGHDYLWLAGWDGELVANPGDDDVPRGWTAKAQIAIHGWLRLNQGLAL